MQDWMIRYVAVSVVGNNINLEYNSFKKSYRQETNINPTVRGIKMHLQIICIIKSMDKF